MTIPGLQEPRREGDLTFEFPPTSVEFYPALT
jgi:hypothetical protein